MKTTRLSRTRTASSSSTQRARSRTTRLYRTLDPVSSQLARPQLTSCTTLSRTQIQVFLSKIPASSTCANVKLERTTSRSKWRKNRRSVSGLRSKKKTRESSANAVSLSLPVPSFEKKNNLEEIASLTFLAKTLIILT